MTSAAVAPSANTTYIIGHKNPDSDAICSAIAYAPTAGTYYIEVEETGSNATIAAYRLHTTVVSAVTTESEPNDIQAQANVLSGLERVAVGNHSVSTDADWYAITVPAGNSVRWPSSVS